MPNPLDPIWNAHGITLDAYGVVRRSLQLPPAERTAALHGSQFAAAANDQEILDALDTAEDELRDQTVMFLYATFEAALRDHLTGQGALLGAAARPGGQFGLNLQVWFTELCKDTRMDKVVGLFEPWAGQVGVARAGIHSEVPALARAWEEESDSAIRHASVRIHFTNAIPAVMRAGVVESQKGKIPKKEKNISRGV